MVLPLELLVIHLRAISLSTQLVLVTLEVGRSHVLLSLLEVNVRFG